MTHSLQQAVALHRALPPEGWLALREAGLSDPVIHSRLLGWDGERITIPVFAFDRRIVAIERADFKDAIARDAMDDTLQELYEDLDLANGGVAALDRMTPAMMADVLLRYVTNYIYARVIHALTAHIHAKAPTVTRIREIERTARYYIEDAVRLDVDTTAFFGADGAALAAQWDAGEGQRVIDRLFEESYRVVEAGLRHGDRGAA